MKFRVIKYFLLFSVMLFSFSEKKKAPVPDYSAEKYWIALPWKKDLADTIPPGCTIPENQQNSKADVFYIHPTVYLSGGNWNADLDDEKINKRADLCAMHQTSIFNAAGRVFAPRYRQAVLKACMNKTKGPLALDSAYADVKAAFEYYLKNWNKGRPIIIAGHSQGAYHTKRLLKDFFEGKELQKKLIVAYPIGFPVQKNELQHLPVGDSATQTGCYVSWNTMKWKTSSDIHKGFYKGSVCVNPLSWKNNENYVSKEKNTGGVSFPYKNIDKAACDAQCHDGVLWIHPSDYSGYYPLGKSYHLADCNLFYMNIRQNAVDRTDAYLKKN